MAGKRAKNRRDGGRNHIAGQHESTKQPTKRTTVWTGDKLRHKCIFKKREDISPEKKSGPTKAGTADQTLNEEAEENGRRPGSVKFWEEEAKRKREINLNALSESSVKARKTVGPKLNAKKASENDSLRRGGEGTKGTDFG